MKNIFKTLFDEHATLMKERYRRSSNNFLTKELKKKKKNYKAVSFFHKILRKTVLHFVSTFSFFMETRNSQIPGKGRLPLDPKLPFPFAYKRSAIYFARGACLGRSIVVNVIAR